VVNAASVVAPILSTQVGSNLGGWFDVTQSGVVDAVKAEGAHLVRWPGGSISDGFNWKTLLLCSQMGGSMSSNSTFDNLMDSVVSPNGLEAAVTVNYGSNSTCTGGGDPAEAAAWVSYSKSKGYNAHHWTVGNEVYGSWEFDLHAKQHDAATYAAAVGTSASNGFYEQMKKADSTAQVGVVVEPNWNGWDGIVLKQASYDFVELHWYAQVPGTESDSYLLTQAPTDFRGVLSTLRSDLASAGKPNTPIMIGEFNSVGSSPGKQTMSIVNALFMGMTYGEILNNGVAMATAWFGYGGTCNNGNNNSSSLYGWQNYGGYDQVSDGAPLWQNCGGSTTVPAGTMLPTGYAQSLVSQFATPGGNMLSASVGSALTNVRAYAASNSSGYSIMLFNLSSTASTAVTVNLSNASGTSYNATTITYGKAQYDNSQKGVWTAPVTQTLGTVNGTTTVTLPPWSMTVLKLN
jgi:hypothetical protein